MTSKTERDARIELLSEQLTEIELRLIPTGLHVFGRPAEFGQKADLLRMVASFDRPELGARSLPGLVAESLGLGSYEEIAQHGVTGESRELIDNIVSEIPKILK